jgi:hypothetical protein
MGNYCLKPFTKRDSPKEEVDVKEELHQLRLPVRAGKSYECPFPLMRQNATLTRNTITFTLKYDDHDCLYWKRPNEQLLPIIKDFLRNEVTLKKNQYDAVHDGVIVKKDGAEGELLHSFTNSNESEHREITLEQLGVGNNSELYLEIVKAKQCK